MTRRHHGSGRPGRVGEPVQVYLTPPERERLDRLAAELESTKSDVLRRGLEALEAATRKQRMRARRAPALPTYRGRGLQPGVDLDDTSALFDLMELGDAPR